VSAPADGETKNLVIQHNDGAFDNRAVFVNSTDTLAPEIISVVPENGADLAPGTVNVVFTFSEAIKPTDYVLALTPSNTIGGLYLNVAANWIATKAGNIPHNITWNSTYTVLTIVLPNLAASSRFTVSITAANLRDYSDMLVSNLATKGSVSFTTRGGVSVSAPVITITNWAGLDVGSTTVQLDWPPVDGATKGYNIYRADNKIWGTTQAGVYKFLALVTTSEGSNNVVSFVENLQTKLTYSYRVRAINSDLVESADSNEVTAVDAIGAILTAVATVPGMVLPAEGATTTHTITLTFNEQMDENNVETLTSYLVLDLDANADTVMPVVTAVGQYNLTTRQVALTVTLTNPAGGTETYNGQWRLQLNAALIKDVAQNTMRTTGDSWNNTTSTIE